MIQKKFFKTIKRIEVMNKKNVDLIRNPIFNKGLAFTKDERNRLGLRGLLMDKDREEQFSIITQRIKQGIAQRALEINDEVIRSGVNPDNVRQWNLLQDLQDTDETLFYRLLMDNFVKMSPIIYTPTVGWACMNFSQISQRPRGMIFSQKDRGGNFLKAEMAAMIYNWPEKEVKAMVVTDGSRILGLGDLGVGGLQICIGKLDLYVAGGGFHPRHVLPVVLDVGTNNQKLINDPQYFGVKSPRLEGEEYYSFVDEFIDAVRNRYPKILIQFEDFQFKHAIRLLHKVNFKFQYRDEKKYMCFNDDIQGTAATLLAGVMGAMKATDQPLSALTKQIYVICGAGSAGAGCINFLHGTLVEKFGMDPEEAAGLFYVMDKDGLITKARKNIMELEENFQEIKDFARSDVSQEGMSLQDVVTAVKPTILIGRFFILGLSAVGGLFTEQIIKQMHKNTQRPIIFALSNPTSRSEAKAEGNFFKKDIQKWTKGQAIFASGSPFNDVEYNGRKIKSSQCNNSYIFPGLALGVSLCQPSTITNAQFRAASEALVEYIKQDDIEIGGCFPKLNDIRHFSCHLAASVIKKAVEENLALNQECIDMVEKGDLQLKKYIYQKMWQPEYRLLIYQKD